MTRAGPSHSVAALALLFSLAVSSSVSAYTVSAGDLMARAVVGTSVNVLRLDVATKATPPATLVVGVDIDYALTAPIQLSAIIRPGVSAGFVDGAVGLGIKYRVVQLDAPFIPYASGHLVAAAGAPLTHGDIHLNGGLRGAVGVDYFVMRQLAIGVEVGMDATFLAYPLLAPEVSVEALFGVSYRF